MTIVTTLASPPSLYSEMTRNRVLASDAYGDQVEQKPLGTAKPISASWRELLKDRLCGVMERTNSRNWDGYDAIATSRENFDFAVNFLLALPDGIQEPDVSAEPDGHFSFEWRQTGKPKIFSISVEKNHLVYAGILSPNEKDHGERPFFDAIPENINNLLLKYFRKIG